MNVMRFKTWIGSVCMSLIASAVVLAQTDAPPANPGAPGAPPAVPPGSGPVAAQPEGFVPILPIVLGILVLAFIVWVIQKIATGKGGDKD